MDYSLYLVIEILKNPISNLRNLKKNIVFEGLENEYKSSNKFLS